MDINLNIVITKTKSTEDTKEYKNFMSLKSKYDKTSDKIKFNQQKFEQLLEEKLKLEAMLDEMLDT